MDVEIVDAGAWSLSGVVADGLADAVPLDHLRLTGEAAPEVYEIGLPSTTARPPARGGMEV